MRTAVISVTLVWLTTSMAGAVGAQTDKVIELKLVGPVAHNAPVKTEAISSKLEKAEEGRRCAFLGTFGSFHLIGSTGTAAYMLGNDKYIADLRSAGEDPNWWLYRPTADGDPWTTTWAFARHRDCGGRYRVLRFVNGAWCLYEQTEAWGDDLDRPRRAPAATRAFDEGPSTADLLKKLRKIEDKLNSILPGDSPSLEDLQKDIRTSTTRSK